MYFGLGDEQANEPVIFLLLQELQGRKKKAGLERKEITHFSSN